MRIKVLGKVREGEASMCLKVTLSGHLETTENSFPQPEVPA